MISFGSFTPVDYTIVLNEENNNNQKLNSQANREL